MNITKKDMNLTNQDYIKILKYYNIRVPKSKRTIKHKAEDVLANKLCRCIKKVGENTRSIGVCTRSVINNKGFKRGNFTCIKNNKNNKNNITLKKR
jgi:hypothetical protein